MRGEWLKIRNVDGRQFRAATNHHGCNHAVGQRTRSASGLVEQPGGQNRVGFYEHFWRGKYGTRQRLGCGIQRAAEIFRPGNGADAKGFIGGGPFLEFYMRGRAAFVA
jgi:hypothetical protein